MDCGGDWNLPPSKRGGACRLLLPHTAARPTRRFEKNSAEWCLGTNEASEELLGSPFTSMQSLSDMSQQSTTHEASELDHGAQRGRSRAAIRTGVNVLPDLLGVDRPSFITSNHIILEVTPHLTSGAPGT